MWSGRCVEGEIWEGLVGSGGERCSLEWEVRWEMRGKCLEWEQWGIGDCIER